MDRASQVLARKELKEVIRLQCVKLEKNSRLYRELNARIANQIHGPSAQSTPHGRPSDFESTQASSVVKRMTSYIAKLTPIMGSTRRPRKSARCGDSEEEDEEY